jgi:Tfp pilus assembly protein PilN
MITTNLSTRPFYNERLVHAALAIMAVCVLGVSVLNALAIVSLKGKDAAQNAQAARAEKKIEQAREAAERIRRSIDPVELQAVAAAATEANRLIDERTFSWTRLFSDFEKTLPADVRISSVAPHIEIDGSMTIQIAVVARRAEDVNEFVDKLEAQGAFTDLVPRQETLNNDGLREIVLSGRYAGSARHAAQGKP